MVNFGFPVGPVRLSDEMGIDVQLKALIASGIKPPESLVRIVADGRHGFKKSGKGFFRQDATVDPTVLPLITDRPPVAMAAGDIQAVLFAEMVQAGKDLLDRGIVAHPKAIDTALIWGLGFPADKGGPMKWADLTGLSAQRFGRTFYAQEG